MVRFRESLTPSPSFHLALALLIPLGFGMLAPIDVTWGIVSAAVFYGAGLVIFVALAPRIVVTDTELRAGRAHIARSLIGTVTPVDRAKRNAAISDARQWRLVRAWIPTAVLVELTDPDDPTPAWFITTRRPEELARALAS